MENSYETSNGNGLINNGHTIKRHPPSQPSTSTQVSLSWLDLRVFYVRISKCEIDDSTPEYLTLNHIPLNPDTLLEVNGVRTGIYSDSISTLLRRDRLDKKTEEATYVSTDSVRVTGNVRFDVFDRDVLLLSGVLDLHRSNGFVGESSNHGQRWSMKCESDVTMGTGFLKEKLGCPMIEVYVAGSFLDDPIILTKTLHLGSRKKQVRMGGLDSILEYEGSEYQKYAPPMQISGYPNHRPEDGDYSSTHAGMEYLEGEDGELSWFNAGVRVGVGIGLSVSVGLGIGVGLLLRAYQGTTNFKRRLL